MAFNLTNTNTLLPNPLDLVYTSLVDGSTGLATGTAANPLNVTTSGGGGGSLTDASGTITAGGTAQTALAANSSRRYVLIENPVSATEVLYFSFTGTASASSPSLNPGGSFNSGSFVPTGALSLFAATTSHAFNVNWA
jgi:hypothetical protein